MLAIEELEQIYSAHCQNDELNLYLLADHSGLPELARKLRENGVAWTNLFGDDRRPELTSASPLLFEVALSDGHPVKRQLLRWLDEQGRFSSSLMLIASRLKLRELTSALTKRCDGVLSDGESIVIRYFDTRVFPHLLDTMAGDEKSIWLGVASHWWFINREGKTVQISSTQTDRDTFQSPMSLHDGQLSDLLQASEIDEIAFLLENNAPEKFHELHPVERYRLIQEKMAAASNSGLSTLGDRALYCALALIHGLEFDSQQRWREMLLRVKAGEITLAQAVELVD